MRLSCNFTNQVFIGNSGQKGFTLIELIAVIIISSVIFIVLGNKIKTNVFTIQAGRDDLVAALLYAQQTAMARDSTDNPIQFIASANSIDVRENSASLPNYPLNLTNDVTIVSGTGTLDYDKLGRTNTPTDTLITLTGNGASVTVTVDSSGYAY